MSISKAAAPNGNSYFMDPSDGSLKRRRLIGRRAMLTNL
jgi:hypothetical protein